MRVVTKTAVIFGGTGYLGSHVVVQLYQKGFQVILAEHPMLYNHDNLVGLSDLCNGQIKLCLVNWNDENAVSNLINKNKVIDITVFAGSQYFEDVIGDSVLASHHFHIDAALTVFSQIEKLSNVPLVLLSSYKVYGNSTKQYLKEDFKLLKGRLDEIELNALTEQFTALTDLKYRLVTARLSVPIGVHESMKIGLSNESNYSEFHQRIRNSVYKGVPFSVKYKKVSGEVKSESRDLIHVVDAAEAIACIVHHTITNPKKGNEIYNVSTNLAFPVIRFAKALSFFSTNHFDIENVELDAKESVITQLSNAKVVAEIGWFNKLQLIDAIKSHVAYLNESSKKLRKAA